MNDGGDIQDTPTPRQEHTENLRAITRLEKSIDLLCDRMTAVEFKLPSDAAVRLDRLEQEQARRIKDEDMRRNVLVTVALMALAAFGASVWSLVTRGHP